jgi:hypothetical protein
MAAQFINVTAKVDAASTPVYSVASDGVKSIVIGLNIANVYGSTLPISVTHTNGDTATAVVNRLRVKNGENVEVMKGNKLVLQPGDSLSAIVDEDYALEGEGEAFHIVASILSGVS